MTCISRRGSTSLLPASMAVFAALFIFLFLGALQTAEAIPAFARKYGLPCSACHEAWPKLNVFGQTFKDNGYQLMNDRDSPIWQNPSYWPAALRTTPNWHRDSVNKVAVDTAAGPGTGEVKTLIHGFDLSGLDLLTGGTLHNNISFLLVPSFENTGEMGLESAWVRVDNLLKSPWLNFKFGKFELDNVISEKRIMTLSGNGGSYQLFHYIPLAELTSGSPVVNTFGQIGDNQLGIEWMGHSKNDRTRVSVALLSSNDGQVNLPNGNAYSTFVTASRAFDTGKLGVQRVGAYYFGGVAPTYFLHTTSTAEPTSGEVTITGVPGTLTGNKAFHREGVFGLLYVKKLDFSLYYQHGWDSAFFGSGTPGNQPLPAEARAPTWNGAFVETHYTVNPQLILIQRSEFVRMSRQPLTTIPSSFGNINAYTFGTRWYPIMISRAGLAVHGEYSLVQQLGAAPVSLTGLRSSTTFIGLDFDF
jgi:hypothetical protein